MHKVKQVLNTYFPDLNTVKRGCGAEGSSHKQDCLTIGQMWYLKTKKLQKTYKNTLNIQT